MLTFSACSAAQGQSADEASALNARAIQLFRAGKYAEAAELAEQVLKAREKLLGEDHRDTLVSVNNLATFFRAQGQLDKAEPLMRRALANSERVLGKDHPTTLAFLANLAALYQGQQRYKEAEPLTKRAFAASARQLGIEHPQTLTIGNNLAELYREQGRYDEAETLYKQVLPGRQRVLGKTSPEALQSLNNLAVLYERQGRRDEALPLYAEALAAREKVLGSEHPDTLQSLSNLATLYQSEGRREEAEAMHKRALEARERLLGETHPDTLISVGNLAALYKAQGRHAEAAPLLKRMGADEKKAVPERQQLETLARAHNLANIYYSQGRRREAIALFEKVLEAREQLLGLEHADSLTSLLSLAAAYYDQNRFDEAEPLFKRALEPSEQVLGKEHPHTLDGMNLLGLLYHNQGRYAEAEPLLEQVFMARERSLGKDDPRTLTSLNTLGTLYFSQGRHADAEPLLQRALSASERVLGNEHADTLGSANELAALYAGSGRYEEAEQLLKRVTDAGERVLGKEHPRLLSSINNLASVYQAQGRYEDAEPLFKTALEARERTLGQEHPDTLVSVITLGSLYQARTRFDEAELLAKRAAEVSNRVLGERHPRTIASVHNLAVLYHLQKRYQEAKPLYERSVETSMRVLGKEHVDTLNRINDLAALYMSAFRYAEAEPLLKSALETSDRVLGKAHPVTLSNVHDLAVAYTNLGRYQEAEALLKRVIDTRRLHVGDEHPDMLRSLTNLGTLRFVQKDWAGAASTWRPVQTALSARMLRGVRINQALTGSRRSEAVEFSVLYQGLLRSVYQLAEDGRESATDAAREMFLTAQWAFGSDTAQSLAQMAARGAKDDPKLSALVRERQDLVAEWQRRDLQRSADLGQPQARRNARREAENRARLSAIDVRIAEIDKRLAATFPDYASLASPQPVPVDAVQDQLRADEALVLFFDMPKSASPSEDMFVWLVTKTDVRWVRASLGTGQFAREVQALRCGLDAAAWAGPQCANLTGRSQPGKQLPFDLARAFRLYKALFGEVEDLIKGKQLLVVPSGPLTQLPFQVLVTAEPAKGDYRSAAWLARDHAITVLPAVASLKALRRVDRPSAATRPLIGFGNPLLDGPDARYADHAKLARQKQNCAKPGWRQVAAWFGFRGGVLPIDTDGGLADVAHIRRQVPLPETADELCTVASDMGIDFGDIRLGAGATESEIKALSESGRLAQYRILHFATHGAMAGELNEGAEPGLILTPPDQATQEDDGYLSASEIAALKLDAEWVILSACNTAAGNNTKAEALSGLARAFIHAQARALLVSHWAVDSSATVKLITATMREMARGKGVGRAEALRLAALALIDKGGSHEAHPAYWAPFVVVGEGAKQ